MAKLIYISPENREKPHGPYTGYPGVYEHDVCTEIGELAAKELQRCGLDTKLAAPGSTMAARVSEANRLKADLYLTIHSNAGGGTGAEVYYYNHPASIKACQLVYNELIKLYPSRRGIKDGTKGYYEIYATEMVSVYPELGFHDNPQDAKFIVEHKQELAAALCKGICAYFGVEYQEAKAPQEGQQPQDDTDYKALYLGLRQGVEELLEQYRNLP